MKRRVLGISASLALALTACGGGDDGGGGVDEFTAICDRVDQELDDLDDPASVDDASSNAKKVADLLEDAVDDMEKVKLGDDDRDAEDLIDNFKDQVDTLDDLITAVNQADFDGLEVAIGSLDELEGDAADLAKDAGARKCALDAVGLVTPPDGGSDATTVPPPVDTTVPPVDTVAPPVVDTTAPLPVDTTGQISDGPRSPLDIAALVVSTDGSTFTNVPEADLVPFDTLLSLSPSTAAAAGTISGVDIISPDGVFLGRAFFFVPAAPLPVTVQADLLPVFDTEGIGVPTVFNPDAGILLLRNGGAEFFNGTPDAVVWILGPDEASIRAAYVTFIGAVGG
jgi:hypothetical protein